MSYEDEVNRLSTTIKSVGNSAAVSVIGTMEVMVFAKRADKEIADLKERSIKKYCEISGYLAEIADLKAQLANSIPRASVEALISELNGDISHANECQHDAIKGFIVDLELFLSNPIESEWMDK